MKGMAYEAFQPSSEFIKCKEGSFGSNNSNEPISVLDTRRSPSPSTSTSTLSSSFGGGGGGGNATAAPLLGVSDNNLQQKWPDSVPHEMGVSGSVANLGATVDGARKDDWPELQPIPAEFELQHRRFGVGLEDWESLLSESAASPAHEQSLLRWISGDVDDTSLSLQQLLQSNQIDETAPPATVFESPSAPNFTPQNPIFFPFPNPDQKHQIFTPQVTQNPPPPPHRHPPPPPPPPQIQFHHQALQKPPVIHQGNNRQPPHQQKPSMAAGKKPEPQHADPPPHHHHHHHQQNQLICDQLLAAAELMLTGNFSHAQGILARLNHQLSSAPAPHKPFHRAAFHFKEAIASLISNPSPNQTPPSPFNAMFKMGAYKMFSEVSPIIQFMNFTSNQTILEALSDSNNIHIIDFDIGFGAQWASFIQELPARKNKNGLCSLKITAFASPSTHHPVELALMHDNLSQFAQEIGVSFQLEIVNFDSFDPRSFSAPGSEAIAVNFPIWSASTHLSAIPSILHFIKQLSPRIVVSQDRGSERTDLPFPHYLLQALQHYEILLDSLEGVNVISDTSNKIQRFLFQPQIERMVSGKLQVPDPMPHWKTLFTAGGYAPVLFSNFAEVQAECVVKRFQVRGFEIEKRHGSLVLSWQGRELMTVSAWKC